MSGNPYYSSPHWRRLRRAALKRDGERCTVPGCFAPALVVDHIVTRPRGVTVPCPEDRLDNLRSLCTTHDAQIKEDTSGQRRRGGRPVVKGCDVDGWPLGQRIYRLRACPARSVWPPAEGANWERMAERCE